MWVDKNDLPPLAPDEFFLYELVGAAVRDEGHNQIGVISRIQTGTGQDVLVIETPAGERLLPCVAEVLVHFDREQKTLVVRPVPGLWE